GWKLPFVVLALLGGAYCVIVSRGVPEPPFGVRRGSERAGGSTLEVQPQEVGQPLLDSASRWKFLMYMAACHFLTMYSFTMMLTWLPYYLETSVGFEAEMAAAIPGVMPLVMAPAAILWGAAADKRKDRNFVLWICLPVAGTAVALIPAAGSAALLVLALILYGVTGKLAFDPILTAAVAENSPPHAHGLFLGSFNFAACLAMVIAPSVTGLIAEKSGRFDVSFFMAGAFHLLALLALVQARGSLSKRASRIQSERI
ncbi:MAG TPA: MFS transporter, partial [Oculatellaceae cyanobacterium]